MTRILRTALFGARHPHLFSRIELLRARDDVELIGFVEDDDAIAAELSRRTGLARLAAGEGGPVDLGIVEGLDPQIPALADAAVAAGARGLLLEKPGAHDPAALYALAERLRAAGVVVELGYELHYSDAARWCREIVRDGVLGQITTSRFHGGCPVGAGAELWQSVPEDLGGLFFTEGCHVLEIVCDLFGVPEQVSASVRRLPPGDPVEALVFKPDLFSAPLAGAEVRVGGLLFEDVGAALMEYPTQTVSVDLTAWEPTTWCTQWWMEIYGTNGSLVAVPEPGELRLHLRSARGRFAAGETLLSDTAGQGLSRPYARQLDSLLARLHGQPAEEACGLDHAVGVMRMLEAIYASARQRRWTTPATADYLDEAEKER